MRLKSMGQQSKSQWDFGELFPTEATRRVLTVSERATQVKRLLEKEIGLVWVTGVVENLRVQSSGPSYFTPKDANPPLNCVLIPRQAAAHPGALPGCQNEVDAEQLSYAVKAMNLYTAASSAIQRFDDTTSRDLSLVARGGGSLEDLSAFNEEVVARTIFDSTVPVVSASGHEIDFTIS